MAGNDINSTWKSGKRSGRPNSKQTHQYKPLGIFRQDPSLSLELGPGLYFMPIVGVQQYIYLYRTVWYRDLGSVLLFIVADMHSFSVVENKWFQHLLYWATLHKQYLSNVTNFPLVGLPNLQYISKPKPKFSMRLLNSKSPITLPDDMYNATDTHLLWESQVSIWHWRRQCYGAFVTK